MPRIIETETRYATQPDCKTAEEMTDICCESAGPLPCCEKVDPEWGGYSEEEVLAKLGIVLDEQGRDEQGRYIEIRFEPRERPCGEMVTKYDLAKDNCCDAIAALVWDTTSTPEVLPAGDAVWIYVTGGQPPYLFSVTSNALFFADGHRSWVSNVPFALLHAGETFCGVAAVRVSDGCSAVVREIRSDQGQWVYRGEVCGLPGVPVQYLENRSGTFFDGIAVSGRYKQRCNMRREQSGWGQYYRDAQDGWTPRAFNPYPGESPCKFGCLGPGASWQGLCDCTEFDMDDAIQLCLSPSAVVDEIYKIDPIYVCVNSQQPRWVQATGFGASWKCEGDNFGYGTSYETFWYDTTASYLYEWVC